MSMNNSMPSTTAVDDQFILHPDDGKTEVPAFVPLPGAEPQIVAAWACQGSKASFLSAEKLRICGVIADKIEDGTLFQAGIFSRTELARFVRQLLEIASYVQLQQSVDWMACSDCGDYYPGDSYDAGFLAAAGHCQDCDAGMVVADPVHALIAAYSEQLKANEYAYFELARTRQTGWMAWICTHPQKTHPDRKILAKGQGESAQGACNAALSDYVARMEVGR